MGSRKCKGIQTKCSNGQFYRNFPPIAICRCQKWKNTYPWKHLWKEWKSRSKKKKKISSNANNVTMKLFQEAAIVMKTGKSFVASAMPSPIMLKISVLVVGLQRWQALMKAGEDFSQEKSMEHRIWTLHSKAETRSSENRVDISITIINYLQQLNHQLSQRPTTFIENHALFARPKGSQWSGRSKTGTYASPAIIRKNNEWFLLLILLLPKNIKCKSINLDQILPLDCYWQSHLNKFSSIRNLGIEAVPAGWSRCGLSGMGSSSNRESPLLKILNSCPDYSLISYIRLSKYLNPWIGVLLDPVQKWRIRASCSWSNPSIICQNHLIIWFDLS